MLIILIFFWIFLCLLISLVNFSGLLVESMIIFLLERLVWLEYWDRKFAIEMICWPKNFSLDGSTGCKLQVASCKLKNKIKYKERYRCVFINKFKKEMYSFGRLVFGFRFALLSRYSFFQILQDFFKHRF